MKVKFLHFLEDYADELVLFAFSGVASQANFIQAWLTQNKWSSNDFFIGVFGQFFFILLMYFLGRHKNYKTHTERVSKNFAALLLGGITSMVVAGYFELNNSFITFMLGFSFQVVYEKFLLGFIEKYLPKNETEPDIEAKTLDGEDRPKGPPHQ